MSSYSISQLCRWFEVPVGHFTTGGEGSARKVQPACRTDQALIGQPVLWLPDGGAPAGLQQEHGAAGVPDPWLAGPEAPGRPAED